MRTTVKKVVTLHPERRRRARDGCERQLIFRKSQVCGVALNVAILNINDYITGELPNTVLKIEFACATLVCFDSHAALC